MPHLIVKLGPGKSEQQKVRLAEEISQDVMNVVNYVLANLRSNFQLIARRLRFNRWFRYKYKVKRSRH